MIKNWLTDRVQAYFKEEHHNYPGKLYPRGIFLLFLIPFFLLSAAIAGSESGKKLTLEDIFLNGKFRGEYLNGAQWIPGEGAFSYLREDEHSGTLSLYKKDAQTGKVSLLIDGANLTYPDKDELLIIQGYEWSKTGKALLIWTDTRRIWRHSRERRYFYYDLKTKNILSVYDERIRNAKISPDGKMIGFVYKNDIYLFFVETGEIARITTDGSENIINGQFDWVYEEEFSIADGWQWSPDGKRIAFWRLDQSDVPEFTWIDYDPLYQKLITIHYPKAGEKNSLVKIGVYNLESGETLWMDNGERSDFYIPRIQWTKNPDILSLQFLNRTQDQLELALYDVNSGKGKVILTETDPCWVDIHDNLIFPDDNQRFLWTSERDGFNHIYLYSLKGELLKQLTSGEWEVNGVYGIDPGNEFIYYSSNEGNVLENSIFRIRLDGKKKKRLTKKGGYHRALFADDMSYFLDYFSAADTPMQTCLYSASGKRKEIILKNEIEALKEYELSYPEFITFKTEDGVKLNAWILKPADFNRRKSYPVLVYCYGGPGSQMVRNAWGGSRLLWYNYLAQHGYIVFCMDNRGTGGRGKAFKNLAYGDISKWAVHDQLEGVKYLAGLSYVIPSRIGIWGWSGGGYLTLMAMCRGNGIYKAGVAVAPVTDFRLYDTIWTERYMGLPAENPEGYDSANVLNYVEGFQGELLLVHGMADDNVHVQNSMQFIEKMQKEGHQFRLMVYPGKNHGISGGNTTYHLFRMISGFILENL